MVAGAKEASVSTAPWSGPVISLAQEADNAVWSAEVKVERAKRNLAQAEEALAQALAARAAMPEQEN